MVGYFSVCYVNQPRLIEIVTILLNRKAITASELAERFGVSVRTIYRDIDVLSLAGIPIYTTQGVNGGISIMEEYSLNRTMLSENDKNSILFALHSLRSTKYPEVDAVLEKLSGIFQSKVSDWIDVDFSPWGSNPNANNKFVDIKNAILKCQIIEIDYINTRNKKTTREIEPLRLSFKHQAWHLWAWCRQREDFRTFRISRIKRVKITNETFDRMCERTSKSAKNQNAEVVRKVPVHCVLQFTEGALYRLYDDYDDTEMHDNGDGTYTIEANFPEDDWVYGYILSFGPNVKVINLSTYGKLSRKKPEELLNFMIKYDILLSGLMQ